MNMPLTLRDRAIDVIDTAAMRAERLTRLVGCTFAAWRLMESGKAQPHPLSGQTLAEVEREIATSAHYGETFLIHETGVLTDRAVVHTYLIRRGKWAGRFVDGRKSYPHFADRLCSVEVAAFVPVEPWHHTPGCDVIGRGNVIEGSRA